MGNNGAISTLPVLPTTYSGGAFIYMPANGIFAGSAAGWYWFIASSTTAGTVYNNTYTSGDPRLAVPTTPTPFVSTGPGVVTQTTGVTDIVAQQITVPGGALGPNGTLRVRNGYLIRNSANGKVHSCDFGGQGLAGGVEATTVYSAEVATFQNVNSQAVNFAPGSQYGAYSGNSNTPAFYSVNTAIDQTYRVKIRLQAGAETDYIIANSLTLEVLYGA